MFPHSSLRSRRLRYAEAADNRHVRQPLRGKRETSGREAQGRSSLPLPVAGNGRWRSVRKLVDWQSPHEHSRSFEGRSRERSPSRTADELRERSVYDVHSFYVHFFLLFGSESVFLQTFPMLFFDVQFRIYFSYFKINLSSNQLNVINLRLCEFDRGMFLVTPQ